MNEQTEQEMESLTQADLEPGTLKRPKEFGIWDTKDKTWMGTADCPLTYGKRTIAQISAQVMGERLGMPMARLMAKRFTGANVKGEDLTPTRSVKAAFKRVMGEE